jgi:hypothetical protein
MAGGREIRTINPSLETTRLRRGSQVGISVDVEGASPAKEMK